MIRLFIHDKCLEQVFQLPKGVQKKVLDFQKKFRYNSKSDALHLEPIQDFKDGQLRTARVDQKYRAIIRVPETGSDYFLLWVDNHDEAMDWARNKTFVWNEHTNAAQIFESPTVEATPIGRTKEKGLFENYTEEQLLALGVPEILLPLVRKIVTLDDLETAEKQLPTDAFENLFYLADGAPIQTLINEIREGAANEVESFNNRRSFIEANDKVLEEYLNGELSKWQVFLHPSQRKLVEGRFNGPVKVTGGGGTGKTVVALHRLKELVDGWGHDKPVLFTTFTKALTENLGELVTKMLIKKNAYVLKNIDSLARELALEHGISNVSTRILDLPGSKSSKEVWEAVLESNLCTFDAAFLDQEYQLVWLYNDVKTPEEYYKVSRIGRGKPVSRKQKMEVASLVEMYHQYKREHYLVDRAELFNKLARQLNSTSEKPFSFVIADEVQDMSNVELRFLRSLVEEKENDMFLVGDPYQKIYSRKINFSSAGINVRGNRSKRLRINYRTTEEIKRLAISTIRGISYDDFDGSAETMDGYVSLFHGERPTYQLFKTQIEEKEFVLQNILELQSNGHPLSSIVIACRLKDAVRDVKSALHRGKVKYFDVSDGSGDRKGVHISTFHNLKGLEFRTVILMGVNKQTAPLQIAGFSDLDEQERNSYLQAEKSLLYVAMTRAIQNLIITGCGVKSDFITANQ